MNVKEIDNKNAIRISMYTIHMTQICINVSMRKGDRHKGTHNKQRDQNTPTNNVVAK